jgi:indole-3-glycerol phosphate synthase
MATYLDGIVAWHRERAAGDPRDPEAVFEEARAHSSAEPARDFAGALAAAHARNGIALIAEIKRRSPSKGDLDRELDPALVARELEAGGASCLSVLTDAPHFAGSPSDLAAARAAVRLPVLRKDFTVCRRDVSDARLMGADAVLLIAAVLSDEELASFAEAARLLEMTALVEVHDATEAARAIAAGSRVIGVNQRDLHTFEVDTARAVRVAEALPADVLKVAESGIRDAGDVATLAAAGYDAVLVGETIMRAGRRIDAVRSLSRIDEVVR